MTPLKDSVEQAASIVAIQQLAIRYAVGVDQRNLDLVADQFVPDVICGHWGTGRDALKAMYHENDATMDVTIHRVTNHMVDLVDDTHATGIVYLDADHRQHDGTWARLTGSYHDEYVLSESEGRWLIESRRLLFWFRDSDALAPTTRRDTEYRVFSTWPTLPDAWPTWHAFWVEVGESRPEHPSVRRSRESAERSR